MRLRGDLFDPATAQVDPVQRLGVIHEGDLAAVRRPGRLLVITGPAQVVGFPLPLAARRPDVQAVLAPRVGEVGDRLGVRRPGWRALVYAGGLGEVARVAL